MISVDIETRTTNLSLKKDMVHKTLKRIHNIKKIHYKKFVKSHKVDITSKLLLSLMNAITISILILDTQGYHFAMVGVLSSSVSTLFTALLSVVNFSDRKNSHKNTFRELTDLHRSITEKVLKNHLSSEDYDTILSEMNGILGIIDDNAPPISDTFS
jgi:hypothetical protein